MKALVTIQRTNTDDPEQKRELPEIIEGEMDAFSLVVIHPDGSVLIAGGLGSIVNLALDQIRHTR